MRFPKAWALLLANLQCSSDAATEYAGFAFEVLTPFLEAAAAALDAPAAIFVAAHGTDIQPVMRVGEAFPEAPAAAALAKALGAVEGPIALRGLAGKTAGGKSAAKAARFAAAVTVRGPDGLTLGAIMVLDERARRLDSSRRAALAAVARATEAHVAALLGASATHSRDAAAIGAKAEGLAEAPERSAAQDELVRRTLADRAHLFGALNSLDIALQVYDAEDRLLFANDAMKRRWPLTGPALRHGASMEAVYRAAIASGDIENPLGAEKVDLFIQERLQRIPDATREFVVAKQSGDRVQLCEVIADSGARIIAASDVTRLYNESDMRRKAVEALERKHFELEMRLRERSHYREALEAMGEGVLAYDAEDRLLYANRAHRQWFAGVSHRFVEGMPIRELVQLLTEDATFPAMTEPDRLAWVEARARRSPEAPYRAERVVRGPGGDRTLLVRDVYTPSGGRVTTLVDVTEHRRAAEEQRALAERLSTALAALESHKATLEKKVRERTLELEEALERQKEVNALQCRFVAMVSHEFRNPLAVIDFACRGIERAAARAAFDKARDKAEHIRVAVRRLIELIESVLETERLREGRLDFNPGSMALTPLVREIVEIQSELAPHVSLRVAAPGECGLFGDARLVRHIASNLISNAIKFSGASTLVEITLSEDADWVSMAVRDYGVGVPANELDNLSRSFYRASTAEGVIGVGIGLNLSRTLAQLHGGKVMFESELGVGSLATLRLPRACRDLSRLALEGVM